MSRKKVVDQHNVIFRTGILLSGSVAIVALVLALLQCFTRIPAGHVGVVNFFGVVSETTLK
jgi:hypothetical protein